MSPKKKRQMVILNTAIIIINILLFSRPFFGITLFSGSALALSLAWTSLIFSAYAFVKGNSILLKKEETRFLTQNIQSLTDCVSVFEEAVHNGDVFDESILKNIEQIARFRRKSDTIRDILLQKFSKSELSFGKFDAVLQSVEGVLYMNMRSILNKISAFDIEEYEAMQKKGFREDALSREKMAIYNDYIDFVNNATITNENILLKMDKMLLEISRYNSLEDGDVQVLPAILEMDELIRNAKLYK